MRKSFQKKHESGRGTFPKQAFAQCQFQHHNGLNLQTKTIYDPVSSSTIQNHHHARFHKCIIYQSHMYQPGGGRSGLHLPYQKHIWRLASINTVCAWRLPSKTALHPRTFLRLKRSEGKNKTSHEGGRAWKFRRSGKHGGGFRNFNACWNLCRCLFIWSVWQLGTAKIIQMNQMICANLTCIAGNCFDLLHLTWTGKNRDCMHGTAGLTDQHLEHHDFNTWSGKYWAEYRKFAHYLPESALRPSDRPWQPS